MGRRELRKINPAIDLTRHLKTFDELPLPWQAELLFARSAPLEVEVGTGKGLFLRGAAASHPERNFLGLKSSRSMPLSLRRVWPNAAWSTH